MKSEIQTLCGFKRQSSIATVLESIAIRKRDAFHDRGHWSYSKKHAKGRASNLHAKMRKILESL